MSLCFRCVVTSSESWRSKLYTKLISITRDIEKLVLLGRHGSVSLCRDGRENKMAATYMYYHSNADISPGDEFNTSNDT